MKADLEILTDVYDHTLSLARYMVRRSTHIYLPVKEQYEVSVAWNRSKCSIAYPITQRPEWYKGLRIDAFLDPGLDLYQIVCISGPRISPIPRCISYAK